MPLARIFTALCSLRVCLCVFLFFSLGIAWCWWYYMREWNLWSRTIFAISSNFNDFLVSTLWLEDFDIEKSDDFTFFLSHSSLPFFTSSHSHRDQFVVSFSFSIQMVRFFMLFFSFFVYHKPWWCRLWWVFPFSFDFTRYIIHWKCELWPLFSPLLSPSR